MVLRSAKHFGLAILTLLVLAGLAFSMLKPQAISDSVASFTGPTVASRLAEYGPSARDRLRPHFAAAGVQYPPARLTLYGIKDEGALLAFAAAPPDTRQSGAMRFIRRYPILKASGGPGPKLREGDRQVPEGIYAIESLNPRSRFHLSLRVNYPNATDQAHATAEGRTDLGGDIMIHGGAASIGCLAMGDEAIEELFVLVADVGIERVEVLLVPTDFRRKEPPVLPGAPSWLPELYREVSVRTATLPR